ncbi:RDD family protein [Streptomyces sp. N2-109]|uniref:RDD family protein n=1 Tax=Streptomyces gossypii TaxID=2883101 RepID=A0ABT2JU16_9ACTN|nr:RDD family protein [Streptomyces gossypii]MCT2591251.1 RDD family protein [Streptomyces gossypii]
MSTEQPEDPFRKRPPSEPSSEPPSQSSSGEGRPSGSPYGQPGGAGSPYGGAPPPPGYGDPYGTGPYGDAGGATDPLAGMPPLGSRGRRLVARIIDALLIGIPVGIILGVIGGFDYDDTDTGLWQGSAYTLVYFVYEGLMLSKSGQTVGKRLMKIRVAILQDGAVPAGPPAWIRAVIYQLPSLVPCLGTLFWLLNVLFCTWDKPYRQCLHDKGAKTVVVAVT